MANGANDLQGRALLAHTKCGALLGIRSGKVIQFRGVPYAEPPVGELSFSESVVQYIDRAFPCNTENKSVVVMATQIRRVISTMCFN